MKRHFPRSPRASSIRSRSSAAIQRCRWNCSRCLKARTLQIGVIDVATDAVETPEDVAAVIAVPHQVRAEGTHHRVDELRHGADARRYRARQARRARQGRRAGTTAVWLARQVAGVTLCARCFLRRRSRATDHFGILLDRLGTADQIALDLVAEPHRPGNRAASRSRRLRPPPACCRPRARPTTPRTIVADCGLRTELGDERLVDLDLVERERLQIGQRRIAGAEIVHRDAHAERLQAPQDRRGRRANPRSARFR